MELLGLIMVFADCGTIKSRSSANSFLGEGRFGILSDEEARIIDPAWATNDPHHEPEQEKLKLPIIPSDGWEPVFMIPSLPVQGVIGREEIIHQIRADLTWGEIETKNLAPLALRGLGGVGKTSLAIKIANQDNVKETFPDGVLWVGLGPKPPVRYLLEEWGRIIKVDLLPEQDVDACTRRLRKELHQRRLLIVIDDIWDAKQGGSFLVAGPDGRTLVTTREPHIAHDLATRPRTIPVGVLRPEDGLKLLRVLAAEAVTTNEPAAQLLCERLEYLPLGITLAGRLLATEADVPSRMQRVLDELIEHRENRLQLLQTEGRLGIADENPVSLQAVLGMSVNRLAKVDQERFAMLAVFGSEPLTWEIDGAAFVWECTTEEAEATIFNLIQRGLVEFRPPDRYWMHALLADYAEELRQQKKL